MTTDEQRRKRKSEQNRLYRHQHPEAFARYAARWKANKKRRLAAMSPEVRHQREKTKYARKKTYYQGYQAALKREMFDAYGGVCACCGEDAIEFLSLDHINGGGNADRARRGVQPGYAFYLRLRKEGWPAGYQVLCFNCNFAKRTNPVCPHKAHYLKLVTASRDL